MAGDGKCSSMRHAAFFLVGCTAAGKTAVAHAIARESGAWVFDTEIRNCVKVGESTYARQPLRDYAPRSTAAADYRALVKEYLEEVRDGD